MLFIDDRGSLCIFVYKVGVEPTAYSLTENHSTIELFATYRNVLPQLPHTLLEYTIQHATYLLSRGLLSNVLRPMSTFHNAATNHEHCATALRSDPSDQYTTLSHTN